MFNVAWSCLSCSERTEKPPLYHKNFQRKMVFLMGYPLKVVAFPASFLPPLTSKKPAMVVKCYTGNQRGEARMKSQLGTCHTKFNRLYSKWEIFEACRVLEDTMNRLEIPLTAEVKRLVKESSGTFKTRVFDLYAEIQKKKGFNVKKRVKKSSSFSTVKRTMNTLIQPFNVSFPSSSSSGLNSSKNPAKTSAFFPGTRTMNTSGLNSGKNKHPPMQLVCKSNNGT